MKEINFLEYLGVEEQNLLTGLTLLKDDFNFFLSLDYIYQEPFKRLIVSEKNELMPFNLLRFIHFHLYFSISCLIRYHLFESLASVRKSIDAGLTAYKLILEPETTEKYLKRDKYFQFIKSYIQDEIKKDSTKYPLANELIKLHDLSSQYGAHADISSFAGRIELKETSDNTNALFLFQYFQIPKSPEEMKFYFLYILKTFLSIFNIYSLLFDDRLNKIDPQWRKNIQHLGEKLDESINNYKSLVIKK
jgi:hypothetical protein